MRTPGRALPLLLLAFGLVAGGAHAEAEQVLLRQPYQVSSALLPSELAPAYQVYRVGVLPDDEGLRWVFTPRQETAQIASALGPLPRAATYQATVRLGGEEPFTVALARQDYDNSLHFGPARKLPTHQWQSLRVPADFQPVKRLWLQASGLEPGRKYVIDWQSLEAESSQLRSVRVKGFACPDQAQSGQVLSCSVNLDREEIQPAPCPRVELRRGERLLSYATAQAEHPGPVTIALPLPAYLASGAYLVILQVPGWNIEAGDTHLELAIAVTGGQQLSPVELQLPAARPPTIGVGERSYPAVFLDLATHSRPDSANPGPHLYRLPVAPAFAPYGRSADCWRGPEQFDYGDLDQRLARLLSGDPQARVLLQVNLDSPPWWEAEHPELVAPHPGKNPDLMAERKLAHISWYALPWQQAASAALQSLVRHLEESPLAGHILGYELDSGRSGGWQPWPQQAEYQDNSIAAQTAFRTWLRRKYTTLADLRVAWGQPRQPVENSPGVQEGYFFTQWTQIKIPPAKLLLDPQQPSLYDPSGQQDRADYQQFLGESTAEIICRLAQAGRAVASGRKLWGACYGHLCWWPPPGWPPSLSGQLGLSRILAGPEIDFLVGPAGAALFPTAPLASVRAHGKLWLEQPASEPDVDEIVASGAGLICADSDQLRAAYRSAPVGDELSAPAQVALVVEETSLAYLSPATDMQRLSLQEQARELHAAGLRYDVWLLSDLLAQPADYPFYVMAATYYVPPDLVPVIQRRLRQPGQVALWLYAPGALGEFIDAGVSHQLTGLGLTLVSGPGSLRVEVPPGDPNFTKDSTTTVTYGPTQPVRPRLLLVGGAETAGHLADSPWPALGLRRQEGAVTVYSAAPGVPAEILRCLAEQAGITPSGS